MINRKIIGLLGIAAAMMHEANNYIDIKEPPLATLGLVDGNKYIGKDFRDKSHGKFSKNTTSRIVKKTVPREGPKIGRNDKCKCGSGQKYKNCCLAKDKNQKIGL